ncbi:MAG: hypothetical protein JST42_10630, partial [Bacteroidetes bacterium]|nr:hypothetical protein [Bacteroidota bacterium]
SWAINNHWETNYRAYQDGIISFRYAMRPHGAFDPAEASQFATGLAQPLVVGAVSAGADAKPFLQLSNKDVLVQVLKPSDDGKAWIVSLFNPTSTTQSVGLKWAAPVKGTSYSNTGETPGTPVEGDITMAAQDVVTLRIER